MPTTVITGSASGIGAATAALLRANGHRLSTVDLRDADILADLSTPAGRSAALAQVMAEVLARCDGRLDGLVLCAGLGAQVDPASLIVSVNYFGAVELLDGLLPALQKGQSPAAVVVSSVASAHLPWDKNPLGAHLEAGEEEKAQAVVMAAGARGGNLAYAGSKNALTVAVRRRAAAWGAAGVRLNTVAPGATETPLLQAGLQDPRYSEAIKNFTAPIARRADASEVASVIGFLMGSGASFVHGAQFHVDGGIDAVYRPTQF